MQLLHRRVPLAAALAAALVGCRSAGAPDLSASEELRQLVAGARLVDLTHTFGPSTPVWEGFGQATFAPATDPKSGAPYTIAADGFHATTYTHVGQYGTHVDPPAHFAEQGATQDEIPVEQMILPLVVLDITGWLGREPAHAITLDDVAAFEAEHGRIPAGAFVALRTDMSKDWARDPARFERRPFPAWSLEVVRFVFEERGAVAIGHESLDTDVTEAMRSETWLLRAGHWQIEALAHLDGVPPTGAMVVATWPKAEGGLGFPARVFAIVP